LKSKLSLLQHGERTGVSSSYSFTIGFQILTAVVMKSSVFWEMTPYSPLKVNWSFGGTCSLHLLGRRISQETDQRESKWQAEKSAAEISGYIVNRKEIVDSKSVPVGSAVDRNELPAPIGSHTQPSEPRIW
jgi:hypothetical protein